MISVQDISARFPKRLPDTHKGDYGHVLVVAGSAGYTGAAYLASQAAMVSGSGLVTLVAGRGIYPIMASKLTEVMVKPFLDTKDLSLGLLAEKEILNFADKCNAAVLGPGISQNKETQHLVRNLVSKLSMPMVIDADGINALKGSVDILHRTGKVPVLTPHPVELAGLVNKVVSEIQADRKEVAKAFANQYNTVLVLKGHATVVASPDGAVYVNDTGNAGMASGGIGDVLAGMIGAFIAQGMTQFDAAVLGVYMHGLAGDLAAREKGMVSLIATDLLNKLPEALKSLA